jgi:hypothetical protein
LTELLKYDIIYIGKEIIKMVDELLKFLSENPAVQKGRQALTANDIYPPPETRCYEGKGWKRRIVGAGVKEWQKDQVCLRNFLDALVVLGFVGYEYRRNQTFYSFKPGAYTFLCERLAGQKAESS